MIASPARILIIEDNAELMQMVVAGLEQKDVEVVGALTGHEALGWVQQQKFDTILLDLGLPGMEGTEVLRRLKDDPASANIPVIVMTGRQDMDAKLRAFELGAADYVTKPFVLVELRARVQSFLRAKRLQDELTQANQLLNAKAELLAMTSHEIRTQLGAVTALSGLLLQTELSSPQRDYAETILSSGESLLKLLNDLLSISKLESGKMELELRPFHLRLCVDDALELLAAKCAEKNLELICDFADDIPDQVIGDDTRLRQILFNLISNALKFTHQGEVVVGIHAGPIAGLAVPEPAADPSKPVRQSWEYHFSIRDTGVGIPPDRLDRLFQFFSQADSTISRQYGGSGLGLFITKGLVELMGGRIWMESKEGQGSTVHFTVNLPVAALPEPAGWQRPHEELAGRRVLLIEDNPTSSSLLSRQMQRWGLITRSAQSGMQALEWLRQDANFEFIIMDAQLPDADGTALAREIRSLLAHANVPILLLTPVGSRRQTSASAPESSQHHLAKPVRPALLQATILRALSLGMPPESGEAERPSAPSNKVDRSLASRAPLRILLAEDNPVNQKVTSRILSQFGYQTDVAGNGSEAIAAIQCHPYDLVLMDVQMPGMGGLEATQRIRAWEKETARPPIYIIALTADALAGDREICLATGMDAYLAKPVRPETLQHFLESVSYERQAAGPRVAPTVSPVSGPVDRPASEPKVDTDRLMECAGGSPESLVEIIDLYLQQTGGQIEEMRRELANQNKGQVARLAHQCAGASGLCGINSLVPLVRELEAGCKNTGSDGAGLLLGKIEKEFLSVRDYLLVLKKESSMPAASAASPADAGVALVR